MIVVESCRDLLIFNRAISKLRNAGECNRFSIKKITFKLGDLYQRLAIQYNVKRESEIAFAADFIKLFM